MLSLPTDKFMTDVYFRAFDEGLVGEFECRQAYMATPQLMRVKWDNGNRYPASIVPAHEWRFLVESIGPAQLTPHRARFDQHRRSTDALRSNLAVGANVQVITEDVPANLLARNRQPDNQQKQPYAVCALVTEVRGPLARVLGLTNLIRNGLVAQDENKYVIEMLANSATELDVAVKEIGHRLAESI